MKRTSFISVALGLAMTSCEPKQEPEGYPLRPVPFTAVEISDSFWRPRLETNRRITIPYAFEQCEKTGRIDNFAIAGALKPGSFCTEYPFDDSDVYKVIQGASYSLHVKYDAELDRYLDELIAKIGAAQEEDGYLYTARTIHSDQPVRWVEPERWSNLYLGHELYNAGHLYEAAAAHYLATGKRSLLDMALKNADLVASVFGPGKRTGVPGHQEIEMGLVKLYRITGERKYIELAQFFLDERGRAHGRELYGEYSQDHKPVIEQHEAVGHAVRAVYMYSAMADIAALTGNTAYIDAIRSIWEDVVGTKIYVTGGIGARGSGEAFGASYELPNATAYAETCASIGNVFWNHCMFLLEGDARYYDVVERTLYNGLLSGAGLSGKRFFYPNPLESHGADERSPWFACACCPSNICRFMPSIPGYLYATRGNDIYVNLFIQSKASIRLGDETVGVRQQTRYPWQGSVHITLEPEEAKAFTLYVRIPGWARNRPVPSELYRFVAEEEPPLSLSVNGQETPIVLEKGFARIDRTWKPGDRVVLEIPMPVRRVVSHPEVTGNRGRVALQRGPLVYCAEGPDNAGHVTHLVLPDEAKLTVERREDLFDGVTLVRAKALALREGAAAQAHVLTAIPYYAWAHRGPAEMMVWVARDRSVATPLPRP